MSQILLKNLIHGMFGNTRLSTFSPLLPLASRVFVHERFRGVFLSDYNSQIVKTKAETVNGYDTTGVSSYVNFSDSTVGITDKNNFTFQDTIPADTTFMLVRLLEVASGAVSDIVTRSGMTWTLGHKEVRIQNSKTVTFTVRWSEQMIKTESSVFAGLSVTYSPWNNDSESVHFFDFFDHNPVDRTNSSIVGFDGTGYTVSSTVFTFAQGSEGNHNDQTVGSGYQTFSNNPPISLCRNSMMKIRREIK